MTQKIRWGVLEIPFTFLGDAGPLTLVTGDQKQETAGPANDRCRLQTEDFAGAILGKRPLRLTPEETRRNLELLDRLYAAARG